MGWNNNFAALLFFVIEFHNLNKQSYFLRERRYMKNFIILSAANLYVFACLAMQPAQEDLYILAQKYELNFDVARQLAQRYDPLNEFKDISKLYDKVHVGNHKKISDALLLLHGDLIKDATLLFLKRAGLELPGNFLYELNEFITRPQDAAYLISAVVLGRQEQTAISLQSIKDFIVAFEKHKFDDLVKKKVILPLTLQLVSMYNRD